MSSQGQGVAESGDITSEINDQAQNLQKGLTSMPLDTAKSSIERWRSSLDKLGPAGSSVSSKLGELSSALTGGSPDGAKIGGILSDLSDQVKQVAASQSGPVASALNSLSSALSSGASSLKK